MANDNTEIQVQKAYERVIPAGEVIYAEGDPGEVLYVIHSGEVAITREGPLGRSQVARLSTGEFFGEMSVVIGEARTERAAAIAETRLLELDGETLESMCIERPEVAIRIIRRLTRRLVSAEQKLNALGVDDLLRPVVRTLVRCAEPAPESGGIRIPTTLRAIAEASSLSMIEAHRAVQQLIDRKLIRLVDDVLLGTDVDSLAACLEIPD